MFGKFVKELRLKNNMGLREFCKKYGHDPSNWSKIERGVSPPPQKEETLKEIACHLGLKKGTDDWYRFFDLAFAEKGRIPADIMEEKELVKKLPLFFRTLRGQKPTKEDMEKLADFIQRD